MGATVVNGDRAGIWKEGDQWLAGGIPWCGSSGICNKDVVALKAIVILQKYPENIVEKPRAMEIMQNLLQQTTVNPWSREMILGTQMLHAQLCNEIPVVRLKCRPDEDAVRVLAEYLEVGYGE